MFKYYGYWKDILQNDDLLPDYDQILEELYDGTSIPAMDYLHGYCTYFAYHLARKYNLPIITVRSYDYHLLHAYCEYEDDNGQKWLLDIRGATTNSKLFFDEFEIDLNYEDWYSFEYFGPANLNKFYNQYVKSEYNDAILEQKYLEEALIFVKALFEDK